MIPDLLKAEFIKAVVSPLVDICLGWNYLNEKTVNEARAKYDYIRTVLAEMTRNMTRDEVRAIVEACLSELFESRLKPYVERLVVQVKRPVITVPQPEGEDDAGPRVES